MFTSNSYPLKKRPVLMEQEEPVDLSVKKEPIKEYRPPTPMSRTPSPVTSNSESVPLYRPFETTSEPIVSSTKCTPEELNQFNPTNWHQSAAPAVPYMAYHPYLHGQNAYPMFPQQTTPPRSESLSPYSQRESSLSPPAPTYSSLIPATHFDYSMRQESQAFHSSHRYAPYSPYSGQLSPASSSSSTSERSFTNHSVTSLIEAEPCSPQKDLSANSDSNNESDNKSTGNHRYQCNDCGKSYLTYSGLTKHQQFHCPAAEGQVKKSFSCNDCDKVYTSLGALKMHIRTHTLPCKCPICGKAFSRPWLLQGHIRTHTGEKPFSCQHCTRSFADRSNLRAHLQTHSDIKKYSCTTCQKSFSRMSLLSKHNENGCPGQTHLAGDYLN